ncbi:acyl-CoA dehydrogenase family protein [Acetobacter senegalensis]|nr:acyl-CoA dehydrogenase family protein [Acetobacter senegalensis]
MMHIHLIYGIFPLYQYNTIRNNRKVFKMTVSKASTISASLTPPTMEQLLDAIAARRADFEILSHIPLDIIALMKGVGIFRASTPKLFGGSALEPAKFLQLVEKIATVDGSAAWVAGFGSANTYLAALPVDTQRKIYVNSPDQIFSGGLYPLQKAHAVPGGWMVSGRWKFASGCMGADWIGVGLKGDAVDTNTLISSQPIIAVCPANEVEIIPNWNVVGMQGTGSHDTQVIDKFVSNEWTCLRGAKATIDEPLFRYPVLAYQAEVHAACSLGLARAALDDAIASSRRFRTVPGVSGLGDRAYFRSALAHGEAELRSARLFFYDASRNAWETVLKGDPVSQHQSNLLRLSAAHAAHTGARVVQNVYRVVGMSAIHRENRLQHIVRDTMVVTQHASLNDSIFEASGALFSGTSPDFSYP